MATFREAPSGRRRKEPFVRSPEEWQQLCSEFNICKRKLQAKSEALLVLAKELDNVRQEKDAFKLMAEQLREKFHAQRKKYEERERALGLSLHDGDPLAEKRNHTLVQILCELRKKNKKAEVELDEANQKLSEAEGDIKLLRESIARQRVGDEGIGTRHFPAHERQELIWQIEKSREQIESLERDMVAKIDEHQEFVTERDYYRTKTERLNQELNYVLGGDDKRIVDVDALVMENKYLKEKMNQHKEEKAALQATMNKYKAALERRRGKGPPKLGNSSGTVLSTKEVENLLAQGKSGGLSASPASVGDLQALATSLLETVHDKSMALQHQKNTNKILGQRVAELEKKLKTLEVAGLWNLPAGAGRNAAFLARERESMATGLKTLLPHQVSTSSDDSPRSLDGASSIHSSARSSPLSTPSHGGLPQELSRRDTGSSLILLEEEDHREASDAATLSRSRSHSSPSHRCHQNQEAGAHLVWAGDRPSSEAHRARERSVSSPSHSCYQQQLMRQETNDSLISLPEDDGDAADKRLHRGSGDDDSGTNHSPSHISHSGLLADDRSGAEEGGGDRMSGFGAQAERELLKNIYEIERGQADGDEREDDVMVAGDEEEASKDQRATSCEDHESDHMDSEEGQLIARGTDGPVGADSMDAVSGLTTSSLENLFDAVTDKFSLKSKEKLQSGGKESTQPSSPLLHKEKPTNLVVIDNTPQCV